MNKMPHVLSPKQVHTPPALLALILAFAMLSGCGGGLFGTGDGSNTDSGEIVDTTVGGSGNNDTGLSSGDESTGPNGEESTGLPIDQNTADSDTPQPPPIAFSNTVPSGLDANTAGLPVVKLINLTNADATLSVREPLEQARFIEVAARQSSRPIGLAPGTNRVTVSQADVQFNVNPLNAAGDSFTTLILGAGSPSGTELQALSTRAAASVGAMAELRVVFTARAVTQTVNLVPAGDNPGGSQQTFVLGPDNDGLEDEYALVDTGDYILRSTRAGSPVPEQSLTLTPGAVYSIIVGDDPDTPFYIEIDSFTDGL